jgi:hypothetical protein
LNDDAGEKKEEQKKKQKKRQVMILGRGVISLNRRRSRRQK